MKPTLAIDANPIISALIGGYSREILFHHHFEFITTEFTISEVIKYAPYIAKKVGVSEEFVKGLLQLLPLTIYQKEIYEGLVPRAKQLISDPKDVDLLALALAKNCPVWSNDAHFEGIKEIRLIKTKDFV